jgi:hypothetical protein
MGVELINNFYAEDYVEAFGGAQAWNSKLERILPPPTMMFVSNRIAISGSAEVSAAGWNCRSQCSEPAGCRRSQGWKNGGGVEARSPNSLHKDFSWQKFYLA